MFGKSLSEGVGVFLENGGHEFAVDLLQTFVIAGLDAVIVRNRIHDVGLHENDGAVVKPICQKVARIEVRALRNGSEISGIRVIGERR